VDQTEGLGFHGKTVFHRSAEKSQRQRRLRKARVDELAIQSHTRIFDKGQCVQLPRHATARRSSAIRQSFLQVFLAMNSRIFPYMFLYSCVNTNELMSYVIFYQRLPACLIGYKLPISFKVVKIGSIPVVGVRFIGYMDGVIFNRRY